MGRYAIFVDAGYLLATGAQSCTGKPSRALIRCDYPALVRSVVEAAPAPAGDQILRTYWYDGADRAVPTLDQLTVAAMPDMKLRLGRLIGNRQKGVDSLIVRDLMTLARERAITTAYLLSGDEDVREGVADAQDVGVRVVLLGLESFESTQAETLVNECDGRIVLASDKWRPFFSPLGSSPATTGRGSATVPAAISVPLNAQEAGTRLAEAARNYGRNWARQADDNLIRTVLGGAPKIPSHMDAELIFSALDTSGMTKTQLSFDLKKVLREGFWDGVRETVAAKKAQAAGVEVPATDQQAS